MHKKATHIQVDVKLTFESISSFMRIILAVRRYERREFVSWESSRSRASLESVGIKQKMLVINHAWRWYESIFYSLSCVKSVFQNEKLKILMQD